MKIIKKISGLSVVLFVMITIMFGMSTSLSASSTVKSGTTGDCTWTLDGNVLTISGNGKMADYQPNAYAPWYNYRSSIEQIRIESGVTYIGEYAFFYCGNATSVVIGDDVTRAGAYAFNLCSKLASVTLGKGIDSIGYGTFFNCKNLTDVYYSGTAANWSKIAISVDNSNFTNATLHYTSVDSNNSVVIDASRYPESSHPYAGLLDETRTFTYPGAQSLTITFSDKTRLGNYGDYMYVYDGSGEELAMYSGTNAANKSLTISGNTFSIKLKTDGNGNSSTDFGYSFSSIVAHNVDVSEFAIEVQTNPIKSIYGVGDTLNTSGLIVSVVYFDGSTSDITSGFTVAGFDSQTTGTKTVHVDYKGKSTSFDVYVKNLLGSGTCGNQVVWTLDDGGTLAISGSGPMKDYTSNNAAPWHSLRGSIKNITIGKGITHIGNYAFYQCYKPTYIGIPNSVTSIGECAFLQASYLEYVGMSSAIESIGYSAFKDCRLRSIYIPKGVTRIEAYTFSGCGLLNNVYIPDSVTSIGNYAFYDCTSLESVEIPQNVTHIGESTFANCEKLQTVNIPKGVTSISHKAFYYCEALSSIVLPDGLTTIGNSAFYMCESLTSITIPKTLTSIGTSAFSGCYFDKVEITDLAAWCNIEFKNTDSNPLKRRNNLYLNGELTTDLVIPQGVTRISDNAFWYCLGLKSVTIPDSVTNIGYEAFYNCNSLESIQLGSGVISIEDGAFWYCKVSEIVIPNSVTSIGENAFSDSNSLTRITLGRGLKSVGNYAFYYCTNLKNVYYLGDEAARETISIGSANDPLTGAIWYYNSCVGGLEHIYSNACDKVCNKCGCARETSHQYDDLYDKYCNICGELRAKPTGVTGDCIWSLDGTTLTISGNGKMADYTDVGPWGSGIREVIIEDGVTHIGNSAFGNCHDLNEVSIGNSVTSIGDDAFLACTSLYEVRFPESLTDIGDDAFQMCSLIRVYIPAGVTSIGSGAFSLPYSYCLEGITVDENNAVYSSDSYGVLFNKEKTVLIKAPYCLAGDYIIPSSVVKISSDAFYYCHELISITIPKGVTSIERWTFSCDNLQKVFYLGNESDREKFTLDSSNDSLLDAVWHYNSCLGKAEHTYDDDCDNICNLCEQSRTAPHYYEWVIDQEATCDATGSKHEECTVCHVTRNANTVIQATGNHAYEWVIDQEATCGDTGIKHEECTVCHAKQNENTVIQATDNHTYDNVCDTVCNVCEYTRIVPHNYEWVIDKDATCGTAGIKHEECTVCHVTRNENTFIEATGNHEYEWVIDKDATCGTVGIKHEECTVCHVTRNENTTIGSTGNHIYDNACDANCNICGNERTPEVHKVPGFTLTNDSKYPFILDGDTYQSTNKTHSSTATFTLNIRCNVSITIDYYTSTETSYDKIAIKHNSTTVATLSGNTSWKSVVIPAVAGDKIYITYSKDGSVSTGNDTVYFKINFDEMMSAEQFEPTCEDAVVCYVCGTVVKSALGHSYSAVCDPSCNICGETRSEVVHTYDNACDTTCNLCGFSRTVSSHVYDNVCDVDCNECGYERTAPHNYKWIIDKVNNCGVSGVKHEECSVCHTKRNENTTISATGNHNYEWIIDKANNCGISGVKHEECTVCHAKRNENTIISATDEHIFDDVNDVKCNVCGTEFVLILFESNGGTTIAEQKEVLNPQIVLSSDYPARNGYSFAGWSTSKNGDVKYQPGETLSDIYNSITLYAQWNKICSLCEGDGIEEYSVKCSYCSGKGTVSSSKTCTSCGGDGKKEYTSTVTCTECNGTGKGTTHDETCVWCAGYGGYFIYKCSSGHTTSSKYRKYSCSYCGSYSITETIHICSTCGGYGTVKSDECTWCDGKGTTPGTTSSTTCDSCSGTGYAKVDCSHCVAGYNTKTRSCTACDATGIVIRKDVSAPSVPIPENVYSNTVILQTIQNGEYSMDGVNWQESPIFENLENGKEYTFYQRYAKTDTTNRSESSVALIVLVHQHTYDDTCDTECNICDYERTILHTYDSDCDIQCNVCGATRETHMEHTYNDVCDINCNLCQETRVAPHSYEWIVDKGNTCSVDGIKHEECSLCHAKRNENTTIAATGIHIYDDVCAAKCNQCQQTRVAPHSYEWVIDKENTCSVNGIKHEECSLCHAKRNENTTIAATGNHLYDNACDTDCNVCGQTRTTNTHGDLIDSIGTHCDLIKCNICGEVFQEAGHTYSTDYDTRCNVCNQYRSIYSKTVECGIYTCYFRPDSNGGQIMITDVKTTASGSIVVPSEIEGCTVTSIEESAFQDCIEITSITIPDSVNYIEASAFENCTKLYEISIGNGVKTIGNNAFTNCTNLGKLALGQGVTKIDYSAFQNCPYLTQIYIVDIVSWLNIDFVDSASNPMCANRHAKKLYLNGVLIKDLVIPDNVARIDDCAFEYCSNLTSVTIGDSVTSIGDYAFANCTGLKNVTIGNGVTSIGTYAFSECSNLTRVTVGQRVNSIDYLAFHNCSNLTEVNITDITTWLTINYVIYEDITGVDSIPAKPAANPLCANSKAKKLYLNGELITELVIPNTVSSIGDYAFRHCSNLTNVEMSDSVIEIGYYAFDGCTGLIGVTIGKNVVKIYPSAFRNCSKLKYVAIPHGITDILYGTFSGCSSLMGVSIPTSVTSIWHEAFDDCLKLTDVYYAGNATQKNNISIYYLNDALLNAKWHYGVKVNSLIEEFVTRLYQVCLNREPDLGGKLNWANNLRSGRNTGIQAANGFIFSQEFKNKNYCNEDYVKQLYRAFMGREADEGGLAGWVKNLNSGMTREAVFNGFALSREFRNICAEYGIKVGSAIKVPKYGTIPTGCCLACGAEDGVTAFVKRLYSVCLNREADEGGLASWSKQLWNHTSSGRKVAQGFIFSKEFTNKNYSNEEFVKQLYRAFMGREADAGGLAGWVRNLENGMTRKQVFDGFAGSKEFTNICNQYGILRD